MEKNRIKVVRVWVQVKFDVTFYRLYLDGKNIRRKGQMNNLTELN